MEIAEVQDYKSLKAYLETLEGDARLLTSQRVAFRAAVRVLPFALKYFLGKKAAKRDLQVAPILGAVGIAGIASNWPTPEIDLAAAAVTKAARAAARAVFHATNSDAAYTAAAAAAANAAETAAYAAANAHSAESASEVDAAYAATMWRATRGDLEWLAAEPFSALPPLWRGLEVPEHLLVAWTDARKRMQAELHPDWSFWILWYERVRVGRDFHADKLAEILNPLREDDWKKGPVHINPKFDKLLALYQEEDAREKELEEELARQTRPSRSRIEHVQRSIERHRKDLPPTFDAIEGFLLLEIERLQGKNFRDDTDREETLRQIETYLTLYDAVQAMRRQVPETEPVSEENAKKMDGLLKVYRDKFAALPRDRADEVVGGVWETGKGAAKVGLISASAALFSYFGLPAMAGVATGALVFAPDKAATIISAAKSALISGKPG